MNVFWLSKNEIFPRSFARFLEEHGICLSRICSDPTQAIVEYLSCEAGIVVMDFSWYSDNISGVALLNEFLKLKKDMKVIIVTSYFQETVSAKYRQLGASGYFTKNDPPDHIIACIKDQFAGHDNQGFFGVAASHHQHSVSGATG